jgi:hypothetical protein
LADPQWVWSMRKLTWQIDCSLQDCGAAGWKVLFHLNGEWFFGCRFPTWASAIAAAEDKQSELVRMGGWTPNSAASAGVTVN